MRDIEGNHCSKKYDKPHQAKKEKRIEKERKGKLPLAYQRCHFKRTESWGVGLKTNRQTRWTGTKIKNRREKSVSSNILQFKLLQSIPWAPKELPCFSFPRKYIYNIMYLNLTIIVRGCAGCELSLIHI